MNKPLFNKKILVGMMSMLLATGSAFADTPAKAEMTKPAGASGNGMAKIGEVRTNQFWWPDQLNLSPLRDHDTRSNPYGADFSYAKAFNNLD